MDTPRKSELTDPEYWNRFWTHNVAAEHAAAGKHRWWSVAGYRTMRQVEFLRQAFAITPPPGKDLLEAGCGNSFWLPILAREFGFRPHGIDYEELGCELLRQRLAREGIDGMVLCADLFHPPADLLNRFDVVASFGLVEHFTDPVPCFESLKGFLKPRGLLVTSVPNLAGLLGVAQRTLDRKIHAVHVLHTLQSIRSAQEQAGLEVVCARYVMLHDFAICHPEPKPLKQWLYKALTAYTTAAMLVDRKTGWYPVNRHTASYIYSVSRLA